MIIIIQNKKFPTPPRKLMGERFCFISQGGLFNDSPSLGNNLINSATKDEIIIIFVQVKQGNQGLQGKSRGNNKDFQVKIDFPSLFGIPKAIAFSQACKKGLFDYDTL
jgi:hypothetical protein